MSEKARLRATEQYFAVRAGIGAAAAVESVDIWPTVEGVVSEASLEVVCSWPASEGVVPFASVDPVVSLSAEQAVVTEMRPDDVVAPTTVDQGGAKHVDDVAAVRSNYGGRNPAHKDVLYLMKAIVASLEECDAGREVNRDGWAAAEGGCDGVDTSSAPDQVVATIQNNEICLFAATNLVIAGAAEKLVVSRPADDQIATLAADEKIGAPLTEDPVIAPPPAGDGSAHRHRPCD